MTGPRRRISMSRPNWGEGHLAADAVVAYVDDELAPGARQRAAAHLAHCPHCAAEVAAQSQARAALRSAGGPVLPPSLLSSLRAIPHSVDLAEPPAGLAVSANGELVTTLDDRPSQRSVSRPGLSRVARVGAVAAMSGLALGALALGVPLVADLVQSPSKGVFGGPVLGSPPASAEARLNVTPAGMEATGVFDTGLWQRLGSVPPVMGLRLRP